MNEPSPSLRRDRAFPYFQPMPRDTSSAHETEEPIFKVHFRQAVQGLRGALTELLGSIDGLPDRPLQLARHLGLNKNLAWKLVKIVKANDPIEAVQHIPGESGVRILLDAFKEHGAGKRELEAVRDAVAEFDRMVTVHTGNRASLELMLGSLAPGSLDRGRLEAGRKLAFQGNSSTLGVQARARLSLQIVAPSATEEGMVDIAAVGGLVGFRRLRSNATWPLLTTQGFTDDDRDPGPIMRTPLVEGSGLPLLADFCSKPLPELRALQSAAGVTYELCEGPVGHTAESTCIFGWYTRALGSVYARGEDPVAEFILALHTPVEAAVFDILVHRDLPFEGEPELKMFSAMHGQPAFPISQHGRYEIPGKPTLQNLGAEPPVVATAHFPRYRELIEFTAEKAGWNLSEFRGYRLELRYPPIPSASVMTYPLIESDG